MILDLDLDFFLASVPRRRAPKGERQPETLELWPEQAVREFLESRCKLDRARPVTGKFVEAHHEVFKCWRAWIAAGKLVPPFEVVHVDAHADLGKDDASWPFIGGELLHRPVEARANVRDARTELHEGDFLAIALACRWLKRVVYVHHRDWLFHVGLGDVPPIAMKNFDVAAGALQLKKLRPGADPAGHVDARDVLELEPEVPLSVVPWEKFEASQPFEFVFLTRSPRYTPAAADALIPVIREYIALVE
jgi:hypothetical protein